MTIAASQAQEAAEVACPSQATSIKQEPSIKQEHRSLQEEIHVESARSQGIDQQREEEMTSASSHQEQGGRSASASLEVKSERMTTHLRGNSSRSAPPAITLDRSQVSKPFPIMPFASLSLSSTTPAKSLLESGQGNSSSHLGLVALDPVRSVLRPEVLRKMKTDFILRGCGAPKKVLTEEQKERERRKSARDRAEELEEEQRRRKKQKREKTLPIVSMQSLLVLEKQLSRESSGSEQEEAICSSAQERSGSKRKRSSAASDLVTSAVAARETLELAALALARHLVDWTEELGREIVSDEEELDEELASAAHARSRSHEMDCSDDLPPIQRPVFLQRQASSSSLSLAPLSYATPSTSRMTEGGRHSSSTSMFDGEEDSSMSLSDEQEDENIQTPSYLPELVRVGSEPRHFEQQQLDAALQQMLESAPQHSLGVSMELDGLPMEGAFSLSPIHQLSPCASPKISPFLSYQAQCVQPSFLSLNMDHGAAVVGGDFLASPLASTSTTQGARISLIQHVSWS